MATTPDEKKPIHILFSAFPAWGHVRPFCILAVRLVKYNERMIITLILPPSLLAKSQAEIQVESCAFMADGTLSERIRVLSSFKSQSNDLVALFAPWTESYTTAYTALSQGKPISCAVADTAFAAVPPPTIVILDFFAYAQLQATRAVTGRTVPIISWATGHAAATVRAFAPLNRGGHGDLSARTAERALRTGVTSDELGDSVYNETDGKVIRLPGIPPMYDWEFFPQELPFKTPVTQLLTMAHRSLKACDAVISASAHTLEAECIDGLRAWFADWGKELYVLGPLLPSAGHAVLAATAAAGEEDDSLRAQAPTKIQTFLDKALADHGERSVMLISFGTIFWPPRQDYIEAVVEVLIERAFPFIISHASPLATLSDGLLRRMRASGLGLVATSFSLQVVLSHAAIGWFLTHGGHNSVMEALGCGIPMICWPFEPDQAITAAHLTATLGVAFELIEVRTGANGMKPLRRDERSAPEGRRAAVSAEMRAVVGTCRSVEGQDKRRRAQEVGRRMKEAWDVDGGGCWDEVGKFLERFG